MHGTTNIKLYKYFVCSGWCFCNSACCITVRGQPVRLYLAYLRGNSCRTCWSWRFNPRGGVGKAQTADFERPCAQSLNQRALCDRKLVFMNFLGRIIFPLTHSHTITRIHTHTHSLTHTHTRIHTLTHTHTHIHSEGERVMHYDYTLLQYACHLSATQNTLT